MNPTPAVLAVWHLACAEAVALRRPEVEPEHFLAAMTRLGDLDDSALAEAAPHHDPDLSAIRAEIEAVTQAFADVSLDVGEFRAALRQMIGRGTHEHTPGEPMHRSDRSRQLFDRAAEIATKAGADRLKLGHLLLGLLTDPDAPACRVIVDRGIELGLLSRRVSRAMGAKVAVPAGGAADSSGAIPTLDRFGRDLTREAAEGRLGPVIGRRTEILQVIQALARRSKNNPVLVGEAGVGKTAIAEALAIRIAQGKDPQVLGGWRLVELNMGSLLAGSAYRGEFEQRLSKIIDECRAHPNVLLFIDELHTVVGAGRGEGALDAANILKPALAKGEIRCLGATTVAEFRRYVESDPALERRFEKILIPEPSPAEALEILQGLRPRWEEHHRVRITDAALEAAVNLSVRFDGDHQLPDKAIDLVDRAGAETRVPALSFQPEAGRVSLPPGGTASASVVPEVTETTIARVLAQKLRLQPEVITGHLEGMSRDRLLGLEAALKRRIVGQDEAVEAVARHLVMAHAALHRRQGPMAVTLFLGPTGVGKTELARALAEALFGSEDEMIRLDMSEFMAEHEAAKLIGSPPGYVGHEEEGYLTGRLRSRPYSVVLLDEIEKAHPRVLDLFLQIFGDGRLTDSKGRTADARHAIFIMTSNLMPPQGRALGFRRESAPEPAVTLAELHKHFRPEFINRIEKTIVFRPLRREAIATILGRMIAEIADALHARHGRTLRVRDDAVELLVSRGTSEAFGARHLRRTVQELVEAPLSRLVLDLATADWPGGIVAEAEGDRLRFRPLTETL